MEGPKYRLAKITFLENHAVSTESLRGEFSLKPGDVFERGKIASGLENLRKLYASRGFWTSPAFLTRSQHRMGP